MALGLVWSAVVTSVAVPGAPSIASAAPAAPSCTEALGITTAEDFHASSDLQTIVVEEGGPFDQRVEAVDRATGAREIISVRNDGSVAGSSDMGGMSADARHVVFGTSDANVVEGDPNGIGTDVFVRDRDAGITRRLGPAESMYGVSISDDGSLIAFGSFLQLSGLDHDLLPDTYLWHRATEAVELLSGDGLVENPDAWITPPVISPDGRHVAFVGYEEVGAELWEDAHVYAVDTTTGEGQLVDEAGHPPRAAQPTFSATDTLLAYEQQGEAAPVRIVDLATQTTRSVTMNERFEPYSVQLLRNGSGLVFTRDHFSGQQFVQDLTSGVVRQVSPIPKYRFGPPKVNDDGSEALSQIYEDPTSSRSSIHAFRAGGPSLTGFGLVGQPTGSPYVPVSVRQGDTVALTLEGANLHLVTGASAGAGVTAQPRAATSTTGRRDLDVAVAPGASLGVRQLSMVGDGGCTASMPGVIEVVDGHPRVDAVEPSVLRPGETTVVQVTGANLDAPTTVLAGPGVAVDGFTSIDTDTLNVVLRSTGATETSVGLTITNSLGLTTTASDAVAVHAANGEYTPVDPTRLLDTRLPGSGGAVGQVPHQLDVTGVGGVPATGVSAVVVNVTVTEPTAPGFVTTWPAGVARPTASTLNFTPGQTAANLATVTVGANGDIQLFVSSGTAHLVVDVVGYYSAAGGPEGGRLHALTPTRLIDTRELGFWLEPGDIIDLPIAGTAGLPPSVTVAAAVLNVTAVDPGGPTFFTAWPGLGPRPVASNLNVGTGETRANLVVVPVAADGFISIYNHSSTAHLVVDLVGWFDDGEGFDDRSDARFTALVPTRILDTRDGTGHPVGRVPTGSITLDVTGVAGVPASGVSAVLVNVTGVLPMQPTFLTVYPSGVRPNASNVNLPAGSIVPNLVTARVAPDGTIQIYNHHPTIDIVADVVGWYSTE